MGRFRRRQFLIATGVFFAAPLARAQTSRTYRIGGISVAAEANAKPYVDILRARLSELGYVEGRNLIIDARYANGDATRIPALMDEVIALKPDVMVLQEPHARLMKSRSSVIPIVLTNSSDPIGSGLAQSLARPGGNVTGVAMLYEQLLVKHIEIMRDIRPGLSRAGQMLDTTVLASKAAEENLRQAAQTLGVSVIPYHVASQADIERALTRMEKDRPEVLLPGVASSLLFNETRRILEETLRLRVPYTTFVQSLVNQGALLSYSPDVPESLRKVATYVDKILKGAKPGDLPIEQPTRFEMAVNLKTARVLGLTIPPSVLLRADRVIE